MASSRIDNFLHKSWSEQFTTAQFLLRKNLARIPYAPVPVRMKVSDQEEIRFWWSYVVPYFDEHRGFFDYWGLDLAELRFLWKHLQPGMTFMDIGAHHGIFTLVAAKRLRGDGAVIAFEPSARESRRLHLHLRMNGVSWVRDESLAVGAATSRQDFFQVVDGDSSRGGLRPPASRDQVRVASVESIRLDDYVSRHRLNRLDIVKLDVEGGEMNVLAGAEDVLEKIRPIFICEVLDAATHAWNYEARDIVLKFQSYGFSWFEFRPDGSIVPHQVRDHYPDVRNYLAVPNERCPLAE